MGKPKLEIYGQGKFSATKPEIGQAYGVDEGSYGYSNQKPLMTTGASACLIAVLHNRENGKGGLAHCSGAGGITQEELYEYGLLAVRRMYEKTGDEGFFDLVLYGGAAFYGNSDLAKEYRDPVGKSFKEWLINAIHERRLLKIKEDWNLIDETRPSVECRAALYWPQANSAWLLNDDEAKQCWANCVNNQGPWAGRKKPERWVSLVRGWGVNRIDKDTRQSN